MAHLVEPEDDTQDLFVDTDLDAVDKDVPLEDLAAQAVYTALVADTGRPKGLDRWKPIVKEVLGVKALWGKRWDAVVVRGEALGLFVIDNSRKYPVLKALDPVVPEPEPVLDIVEPPKAEPVKEVPPPEPVLDLKNWHPAEYLDCGHWNYQTVKYEEMRKVKGKEKEVLVPLSRTVKIASAGPEYCLECQAGKAGHPQAQKGDYRTPVVGRNRRTVEKDEGPGFPGYCCNAKGYYIGGIGNLCIRYLPKGEEPCVVHAPKGRRKADA